MESSPRHGIPDQRSAANNTKRKTVRPLRESVGKFFVAARATHRPSLRMLFMKKTILLLTGALAVAVFAGCASSDTTKTARKTTPSADTAAEEEYVQYTSLGSRVPRKVKKSDVKPSDAQQTQDAFREIQSHGNIPASNLGN